MLSNGPYRFKNMKDILKKLPYSGINKYTEM